MSDLTDATLFLLLVLGAVILMRATVPAMLRALRGHFADRRRFPGQMDERLEGMAKVAQGATETREGGRDE